MKRTAMKRALVTLLFILTVLFLKAQHDGMIRGRLLDTATHQYISNSTVTVLQANDSSLVSFSRSLENGEFLIKSLPPGHYRLLITHVSYLNLQRNFTIQNSAPATVIDFGNMIMLNKSLELKAVTVTQEAAPVTLKNDTIEYNAGSFKTKPNAVVEDLLKKLPGVQVDKNGNIKANGEDVKKVLVDGKEFFGNDPKIASKNLPADAVDKVQVFNKKSEQAQFTGFDDGNSQKAINLTIKKDKKNGLFGKATAAAGGDGRYESSANLNEFQGDQQFSVIGLGNNTNKQGFSFQDVMSFTGGISGFNSGSLALSNPLGSGIPIQGLTGNNQAITTTLAAGLNYNDKLNRKTDWHGNYFYNHTQDDVYQNSTTHFLVPGNDYIQNQETTSKNINENHRINLITDSKIDSSNSLRLNSSFIYQDSRSASDVNYNSVSNQGAQLNDGISNHSNLMNGYNWNNDLLMRHRFAKKGRTLSADLTFTANNSKGNSSLYSINRYYQPNHIDTISQINDQYGHIYNYSANLVYTEPLSRKTLLEFNYRVEQNLYSSGKHTFDADAGGKFTSPNPFLTNDFKSNYLYNQEGFHIRSIQKKLNIQAGFTLQQTDTKNDFAYVTSDSSLHQSFLNLLPDAEIQYKLNKYKNLEFYYNSFTRQPSTSQLQPVPDNSDPLNIKAGNPSLRPEFYHILRMIYGAFDPFRHTSFFAMANFTAVHHKIVNDDRISSNGIRVSVPVNVDGLYNMKGNLTWGFPFRKLKSNVELTSSMQFDHNANLVNGERNTGNNLSMSQRASLNYYYKELLDVSAGVKLDYNNVTYSLQPDQNMNYWTQNYTFDFNLYLPKGFSIATDFDYLHRVGLPEGYNQSPFIWNAGLAKQVFRNKKGEIHLQVFDILKQNVGISRNTSQNFTQDIAYQVLNRYWLIGFTYKISRFAGKAINSSPSRSPDVKIINQ